MEKEIFVNRLQVKALLLDAITYHKFKSHITPHYKSAKNAFCKALGISPGIRNTTLILYIGGIYRDNGLLGEFSGTLEKFNLSVVDGKVVKL